MIQHLLQVAQKKGPKKVFLLVHANNIRTIRLYLKTRFEIEAILRKERIEDDSYGDEYRMATYI